MLERTFAKMKIDFYKNWNKYQKILVVILILYTIVSFINLGNFKSPKTFVNLKDKEYVIYQIESNQIPNEIVYFTGNDDSYLSIYLATEYTSNLENFKLDTSVTSDYAGVFSWHRDAINPDKNPCKYIMVYSYWDSTTVGEVAFLDEDENIIPIKWISGSKLLNDEQELIQTKSDYLNSTYFDEVYFPRAAYEIFHNKYIFEYTHPPLGKIIMWIPVALFGLSPFTYRFMGNIAGILMILVMYHIAKELFKDEKYGVFAAAIIALDGMHFAQTRIGTVDSFLVLFALLSILYFIKYLKLKNGNRKLKYQYLGISGAMWGCAVSVKWLSCYLGLGLGIIFFIDYFWNQKCILNKKFNYKPILMGILCFVIIPISVYVFSYLPIYGNENAGASYNVIDEEGNEQVEVANPTSIKGFLMYQYAMFQYHSNIGTGEDYQEHPFASKWYTWPISYRPMWFYTNSYDNDMRSTIATMGNPAIWWLSIITAIGMVIYTIIKKDKVGAFLIILILATWLPYAIVSREMYIYHYFLTSILMMLTIVFAVSRIINWKPKLKFLIPVLTSIFVITFVYFYPIYSGMIVPEKYIESTKWLSSWSY